MCFIEGIVTSKIARVTAMIVVLTAVRTIKRKAMVKIALVIVAIATAMVPHSIMQSQPPQLLLISSLLLYPRS